MLQQRKQRGRRLLKKTGSRHSGILVIFIEDQGGKSAGASGGINKGAISSFKLTQVMG